MSSASHIKNPEHWRARAEEMRAIAEEMHDPEIKARMLGIDADYDKLAQRAEERAGGALRPPKSRHDPRPVPRRTRRHDRPQRDPSLLIAMSSMEEAMRS